MDDLPLVRALGRVLPSIAADAIEIAVAIYVADRLAPRHDPGLAIEPSQRWPRRIFLTIPVRDPAWWNRPESRDGYERLLAFLGDDDWRLTFRRRAPIVSARPAETQLPLGNNRVGEDANIVLHSGGLDGTLGLIEAMGRAGSAVVLPTSVTTNLRTEEVQNRILIELARTGVRDVPDLRGARIYVNLHEVHRSEQESTQRVRSVLYLTVGAVAAFLSGRDRFHVAEHGTGAINLPYTPDQFGARTSKAVNPVALARFSDVVSLAFDWTIEVHNPLLWETKGEAAQRITEQFLFVAKATVSCDRFPWHDVGNPCGACLSCAIRAAALGATRYGSMDLGSGRAFAFDPTSFQSVWSGSSLLPLHAMRYQVGTLRAVLESPQPRNALLDAYPDLYDVVDLHQRWSLTRLAVGDRLVRLYTAYVEESDRFFATFARPGWGPPAPISELTQTRLPAVG